MRVPFSRFFGSRLHNQIVIPLVIATALVGLVATFLGVWMITEIVDRWISANTIAAVDSGANLFEEERVVLRGMVRMLAEDPRIIAAADEGSISSATQVLLVMRPAVGVDSLMLIDESGRVVAHTGRLDVQYGDVPFPQDAREWSILGMKYESFEVVEGLFTISAFNRVRLPSGDSYRLVASSVIDAEFLDVLGKGLDEIYCFTDEEGTCIASTQSEEHDIGEYYIDILDHEVLREAMDTESTSAISLGVAGDEYWAALRVVTFEKDPCQSKGFLIGIAKGELASETRSTTISLIAFWSVIAISTLWMIGIVIAKRVSKPVVELTSSVHQVAKGDYSRKVDVYGFNEISNMAESFNEMTDSLRERNESLTKKVLELSTLYEMSRIVSGTLELDPLLDSVLDSALRIFDLDSGHIILRERHSGELSVHASRGIEAGRSTDIELKSSICEWVIREGRPLIFNPGSQSDEQVAVDSVTGATSALCVPLVSAEGPIGALTVGTRGRVVRFTGDDVRLLSTVANHATVAIGNIELFITLQEAYLATVRALAAAVDAKDAYTRGHSDHVAEYALLLAKGMKLSSEQTRTVEMAAYLHDIGKIGVKESILLKPGKLDPGEIGEMRHHPLIGANILSSVIFPWPVAPIIRHHHEQWDGTGYPAGLKGEEIPLLARVLSVADAFEAMTSERPYRKGMRIVDAVEEMNKCRGSQFDSRVVDVFIHVLRQAGYLEDVGSSTKAAEFQQDELRAAFAAICDEMFDRFRRLGGPRLSANAERELDESFADHDLPATCNGSRIFLRWDGHESFESEREDMTQILSLLVKVISKYTGMSLVEHFYRDALSSLSMRLQWAARSLDLRIGE